MPVLTVLTSSSHGLEGRVTRCVEKGDFLTAVQFDPEPPMSRDKIADEKLQIFKQVSQSCDKLIPKLSTSEKKKMIDKVKATPIYK